MAAGPSIVGHLVRVAHELQPRVLVVLGAWRRRHCVAFAGDVARPPRLPVVALVVDVAAASDGADWVVDSRQQK